MSMSDQENSFHVYGGNSLKGGSLASQRGLRKRVSKADAIDVHDAHSEGRERADSGDGFFLVPLVQTDGVGSGGAVSRDGDAPPSASFTRLETTAERRLERRSQGEAMSSEAMVEGPCLVLEEGLAPISKAGELEVESKPTRCTTRALDLPQTRDTSVSGLCTGMTRLDDAGFLTEAGSSQAEVGSSDGLSATSLSMTGVVSAPDLGGGRYLHDSTFFCMC